VTLLAISERPGTTRFDVRVQPRASRDEIAGAFGGALRVRLRAPPVDGAANEALVGFLAESLGVSRRNVRIVAGHAGRQKTIEVDGSHRARVERLAAGRGADA
jgi:uncharacterized protein (TIGR00251 family)